MVTSTSGEQKTPTAPVREIPEKRSSDLKDLAQRLRHAEGMTSDEVSQLVSENWSRVVGTVVVILIGIWLVNELRANQERALGEASQRFSAAQEAFASLREPAAEGAKPEEKLQAFRDTLRSLKDSYSRTGYAELAVIYDAAVALSEGKPEKTLEALSAVSTERYFTGRPVKEPLTADSFRDEMAALLLARAKFAQNRTEGRQMLLKLVTSGQFVNVEALRAFARTASTAEERKEAVEAARRLQQERADIASQVKQEMSGLGMTL